MNFLSLETQICSFPLVMQIWFSLPFCPTSLRVVDKTDSRLRLTYHQFALQIGLGHKGFLFPGSCWNYQNFKLDESV